MTSIIKYIYNVYKKLYTGCNSTEVLNSVEIQKDEIVVSVTSDVQEVNETIAERTRANTMYEETKTSINENVEQLVSQGIDVIDAIHTTLTDVQLKPIQETIQEPVVEPIQETTEESTPEPIQEDQQSEYSSIHSPPPSPEYYYTENQTEIIGVVVDTDDSSYNKFI